MIFLQNNKLLESNTDEMRHKIHEQRIIDESYCHKDCVFSLKNYRLETLYDGNFNLI